MTVKEARATRASQLPGEKKAVPRREAIFAQGLYRKQASFIKSEAPTVVMRGGAGSGKTISGVIWSLLRANNWPGSRGMIVSPTYSLLWQSVMPHLEDLARKWGMRRRWRLDRGHNQISFRWGSTIYLRSADRPSSLLGADLAWVWGDEIALWKEKAYQNCVSRVRQVGYKHQLAFTFTPKGRNWVYRYFGGKGDVDTEIIRTSTYDNIYVGEDYARRMEQTYGVGTEFFEQEVLGEFVRHEGLVYSMYDEDVHYLDDEPSTQFDEVVAGVDWGWTNPGAIEVLGRKGKELTCVAEVYETGKDVDWWADCAEDLAKQWRIKRFKCDPSRPEYIAKFRKRGLNASKAETDVVVGITTVSSLLQQEHLFVSPGCPQLHGEFLDYCWQELPGGSYDSEKPIQLHDHALDALRYGAMDVAQDEHVGKRRMTARAGKPRRYR